MPQWPNKISDTPKRVTEVTQTVADVCRSLSLYPFKQRVWRPLDTEWAIWGCCCSFDVLLLQDSCEGIKGGDDTHAICFTLFSGDGTNNTSDSLAVRPPRHHVFSKILSTDSFLFLLAGIVCSGR